MKKFVKIFIVALVVSVFVMPATASAKNLGYKWPNTTTNIFFYADEDIFTSAEISAMRAALNTWNAVNSMEYTNNFTISKKYMYVSSTSSAAADRNYITIPTVWPHEYDAVAHASTVHSNGIISSSSIHLNDRYNFSIGAQSGCYDLQSIILHEAGHSLGIAHCHEVGETCRSATCSTNAMRPQINTNTTRRTLQAYDYSSYIVIYQQL